LNLLCNTLLSAVDELTGVHAFGSNEEFFAQLISVWVSEDNASERSTTAWVVNDFLDQAADITVAFSKVQGSDLRGTLSLVDVGAENGTGTFSLGSNNSTHCLSPIEKVGNMSKCSRNVDNEDWR
jgi:hypothetical protein